MNMPKPTLAAAKAANRFPKTQPAIGPGDYIAISVESQKGGVGKTTVALNVARLLSKRYRVLFLDLDIAGTEAATVPASPIWCGDTQVVSFSFLNEESTSRKDETRNLVDLYYDYMSGSPLPNLKWSAASEKEFPPNTLHPKRINILSSSLVTAKDGHSIDLQGPQVLFDEAHAAWFLDMIREIVAVAAEPQNDERSLAVVIDTSPGFSGLAPNIEEWLTDLGPDRGKFVFVASADQQDIRACVCAIKRVEDAFHTKLRATELFRAARSKKDRQQILDSYHAAEKGQQKFFMRLAEQPTVPQGQGVAPATDTLLLPSPLAWYINAEADVDFWLESPCGTWRMSLNRVPSVLMSQNLSSHLPTVIPSQDDKGMARIVESCRDGIMSRTIPHNSLFALQFVDTQFLRTGAESGSTGPTAEEATTIPVLSSISSGRALLQYVVRAHFAFHDAALALRVPANTSVRISFLEFSPLWLFTQQLRHRTGASELAKLSRTPQKELEHSALLAYDDLIEFRHATSPKIDRNNWVLEALVAAQAVRLAITRITNPGTALFQRVSRHAARVCEGLTQPPLKEIHLAPWPRKPIDLLHLAANDEWQLAASQIHTRGAGFMPERDYAVAFINAYNHVLRAEEPIKLMRSVASLAQPGENTSLLLLFAESLFRHVVLQRDTSFEAALKLFEDLSGSQLQDPRTLIIQFLSLRKMETFDKVLGPILKENTWRFI